MLHYLKFVRIYLISYSVVSDRHKATRPVLYELRHQDDDALATEQRRRTGVQRVRPIFQVARREQAAGYA